MMIVFNKRVYGHISATINTELKIPDIPTDKNIVHPMTHKAVTSSCPMSI